MKRKSVVSIPEKIRSSEIQLLNSGTVPTISDEKIDGYPNEKSHPNKLLERLIQKEIHQCAKQIGIDEDELSAWILEQTSMPFKVPNKTILHLLRTATKYQLDPLQEEVVLTQYDNYWEVIISIDGWIKLMNAHPAFSGISFHASPEQTNGVPDWMECSITRSDRTLPITTREYLSEVRNDSDYWKRMPRRMLRHKAMQQCARIALGIGTPDFHNEKNHHEMQSPMIENSISESKIQGPLTQTEKLKSLLGKST